MSYTYYEVNLQIDNSVFTPFMQWLKIHLQEMVQLPGFLSYGIKKVLEIEKNSISEQASNSSYTKISVLYKLESTQAMNDYFNIHSQKMRGDGIKQFGGKFTAERRCLKEYQL